MIKIKIVNAEGNVVSPVCGENVLILENGDKDTEFLRCGEGDISAFLSYAGEFQEGDRIQISFSEKNCFYYINLDDAVGESLCYVKDDLDYPIPFGEKHFSYSSRAFAGQRHMIMVRKAQPFETESVRLISKNPIDFNGNSAVYPHASANVETRGEANFAARNAIDGLYANLGHWGWPYASWGINRDPEAAWTLEFGRPVDIQHIVIYNRADFPHDTWWATGVIVFSDGTEETVKFEKTENGQCFDISKKGIEWLRFERLIKADDSSPFPALSQFEVWGK